jgi:hypothetical protein
MKVLLAFLTLSTWLLPVFLFAQITAEAEIARRHLLDNKSDLSLPNDFTLLGQWKWGACWGVAMIDSTHIIIGNGELLQILNISDRTHPVMVSEIELPGTVLDIVVHSIYAYAVGSNDDLDIIDLSDLNNPTLVSHWFYNGFNGFYFQIAHDIRGLPYLYLGGTWFTVLDISNPLEPQVIAEQPIYPFYIWQDMEVYADTQGGLFVYAPNSEGLWLEIFDVTDPANPVSYPNPMPNPLGLCIVNDLLFVGSYDQIRVYSLLDPQSPSAVGEVQIPPIPYDLATDGDYLYAGLLESDIVDSIRVMKLDLTDPTNPAVVDSALWPGPNPSNFPNNWLGEMVADRQEVIVSSTVALWGIDFDNPGGAETLFYYPTGYRAYRIRYQDELGFIASGPAGLWILDLSDLTNPREVGHYRTLDFAQDIAVQDTIVYLITETELLILNVTDPALPNLISILPVSSPTQGTEISGDFLYIPSEQGLIIVDVSSLNNPQIVNIFPLNHLTDVAIQDSLAFIARGYYPDTNGNGLHILNINNPTNPIEIGAFTLWGAKSVKTAYPYAYVATSGWEASWPGYNGFSILDISNPVNPIELSRRDTLWTYGGSTPGELAISDSWVYYTRSGTKVIDISDKLNPRITTTIEGDLTCEVLQRLQGSDILIVGHSPGISIYRHDFTTGIHQDVPEVINEFRLYQNYPNPFNPRTTIEFYMPRKEKITIEIFNILGQKVKTLLNTEITPGKHRLRFDASDLPSGLYIYRLRVSPKGQAAPLEKAPGTSLTQKMVLLR